MLAPIINPYDPHMTKEEMKRTWEKWLPRGEIVRHRPKANDKALNTRGTRKPLLPIPCGKRRDSAPEPLLEPSIVQEVSFDDDNEEEQFLDEFEYEFAYYFVTFLTAFLLGIYFSQKQFAFLTQLISTGKK